MDPLPIDSDIGTQVKILLVDDRTDKLMALESLLSTVNVEIVKATSGRDALRFLLRDNFALILLDVNMPGMDGFETASLIRQRAKTEHTPIIFITSINTNETHISRGYSLGAVDYIFTPVVPEVLKAKVMVFIDLYRKNEMVRHQSEALAKEAARRATGLESRLRRLLNRLDVGVFRATLDGTELREVNPALLRILSVKSITEIKPEHVKAICCPSSFGERTNEFSGPPVDIQLEITPGLTKWISLTRIISQDGDNQGFVDGLVEDITLRKEAEQNLKQLNETLELRVQERTEALRVSQEHLSRAERLASLGTLAAGIAHEINNPLNSILMVSEYAIKNKDPKHAIITLGTIAEETRRCGKIIRGVLQFARNESTAKTPYDLNEVVAHSVDIARTYVSTPIRIELKLARGALFAAMNVTEIEQVVVNLIQNAAEAAPSGTSIVVSTQRLKEDRIRLCFQDSGPGIKEDIIDNIFDPFFSTRRTEGGTGLGLSVAHGIVSGHGGELKVVSKVGSGTVFSIELPSIPAPQEGDNSEKPLKRQLATSNASEN